MDFVTMVAFIGELIALIGMLIPVFAKMRRIGDGTKCQLRSEMLNIYYHNVDSKEIRQYEYENFVFLYEAYKALKGNSFIDKIYKEVQSWKIVT